MWDSCDRDFCTESLRQNLCTWGTVHKRKEKRFLPCTSMSSAEGDGDLEEEELRGEGAACGKRVRSSQRELKKRKEFEEEKKDSRKNKKNNDGARRGGGARGGMGGNSKGVFEGCCFCRHEERILIENSKKNKSNNSSKKNEKNGGKKNGDSNNSNGGGSMVGGSGENMLVECVDCHAWMHTECICVSHDVIIPNRTYLVCPSCTPNHQAQIFYSAHQHQLYRIKVRRAQNMHSRFFPEIPCEFCKKSAKNNNSNNKDVDDKIYHCRCCGVSCHEKCAQEKAQMVQEEKVEGEEVKATTIDDDDGDDDDFDDAGSDCSGVVFVSSLKRDVHFQKEEKEEEEEEEYIPPTSRKRKNNTTSPPLCHHYYCSRCSGSKEGVVFASEISEEEEENKNERVLKVDLSICEETGCGGGGGLKSCSASLSRRLFGGATVEKKEKTDTSRLKSKKGKSKKKRGSNSKSGQELVVSPPKVLPATTAIRLRETGVVKRIDFPWWQRMINRNALTNLQLEACVDVKNFVRGCIPVCVSSCSTRIGTDGGGGGDLALLAFGLVSDGTCFMNLDLSHREQSMARRWVDHLNTSVVKSFRISPPKYAASALKWISSNSLLVGTWNGVFAHYDVEADVFDRSSDSIEGGGGGHRPTTVIRSIDFLKSQSHLQVTASQDQTVRLWDSRLRNWGIDGSTTTTTATTNTTSNNSALTTGSVPFSSPPTNCLGWHEGGATDARFILENDERFVVSSGNDGVLKIWDLRGRGGGGNVWNKETPSRSLLAKVEIGEDLSITSLDVTHANGGWVLINTDASFSPIVPTSTLLSAPSSLDPARILQGHSNGIWRMGKGSFSPDGNFVACGSDDGCVFVWEVGGSKGQLLRKIGTHTGLIWDLCWIDNSKIAAISDDGGLAILSASKGYASSTPSSSSSSSSSSFKVGDAVLVRGGDGKFHHGVVTLLEREQEGAREGEFLGIR